MKTFRLNYDGYYTKNSLPIHSLNNKSGLYSFYEVNSEDEGRLLYIGKASDLLTRLSQHEMWDYKPRKGWTVQCNFAFSPISNLDRLENALIFEYQPPKNIHHKTSFPYPDTTIKFKNAFGLFDPQIIIRKTEA